VTAGLLRRRFRLGEGQIDAVGFHLPWERDGFRLRLLPAGHIAGSAMLHVTRLKDHMSLLYTGDFKIRPGRTAEPIGFLVADTLIMETTFGLPSFVFPSPLEVESTLLRFVHDALADGETPVLCGYALGKAQEVLALLAEHDIPVLQHPAVAAMTRACRELGVDLPEPIAFEGFAPPGHVVVAPPSALRSNLLRGLKSKRIAMLTGWALQAGAKYRYRVDEVIPFSDHADHPGLLECVRRVRPRRVLTVHGFAHEFAAELRAKQIDAWCAMGGDQLELSIAQAPQRPRGANSPRHARAICALADFSDLCRLVGETNSRVAKAKFIAGYLRTLESDHDLRLAVQWLSGDALPFQHGERSLRMRAPSVRHALLALPGARAERYQELFRTNKDAARTARLVLQEIPLRPESLDLPGLEAFFHALAQSSAPLERIRLLTARIATLHPTESETLVRLLVGDSGHSLEGGVIEEAIASAFSVAPAAVRAAHRVSADLAEIALLARHARLEDAALRPLAAVRPMQAVEHPCASTGAIGVFAEPPFALPLWLEPECRGVRAQVHKLGREVAIFGGDLRPLDGQFPCIQNAAQQISGDFIIDGVILTKRSPNQENREGGGDLFAPSQGAPPSPAPRFRAFDVLWLDGECLLEKPLSERRARLDGMLLTPPIGVIGTAVARDAAELDAAFKQAMLDGHQGLMAKDPDGLYLPGTRVEGWLRLGSG
jgi:DNA ligase-1